MKLKHVWTGIEFEPIQVIETTYGKIYRADPKVGRHGNFSDSDSLPVDDPYHQFILETKIAMLDSGTDYCYYGYNKTTKQPLAICGQAYMINRGFGCQQVEMANPDFKMIWYGQLDIPTQTSEL
jgi:hypothetical protein